jgi:hydroxymethylglutaryl-CoA synthase
MSSKKYGIASIGLHIPDLVLSVEELARLRNVDPNKYTQGLGCKKIALCREGYDAVDLAAEAARRALSRWKGDLNRIALLAVGTESAKDMSRPMSAFVAEKLGLKGAVRSYEVKHACYGGTVALRQALEWKMSGVAPEDKVALVIATDVALYEQNDPGEPTQGAGAVAMIIDEPLIAEIESPTSAWSEPAFDFWRPVGHDFPLVEGQFSLECYQRSAVECFKALIRDRDPEQVLEEFRSVCFHVPFPKMVKKGFIAVGKALGWDDAKIEKVYQAKIDKTMDWNRLCGNAYTGSLWIAVAYALCGLNEGERIAAFSYGSGFGAELLTFNAGILAKQAEWAKDMEFDFAHRKEIKAEEYQTLRDQMEQKRKTEKRTFSAEPVREENIKDIKEEKIKS